MKEKVKTPENAEICTYTTRLSSQHLQVRSLAFTGISAELTAAKSPHSA